MIAPATPIARIAIPRPGTKSGVRPSSAHAQAAVASDGHRKHHAAEPRARPELPQLDRARPDERRDGRCERHRVVGMDDPGHEAEDDDVDREPGAPQQVAGDRAIRSIREPAGPQAA